jgi:hypothetical protein
MSGAGCERDGGSAVVERERRVVSRGDEWRERDCETERDRFGLKSESSQRKK